MEPNHLQKRTVEAEGLDQEQARLLYEYAGPGIAATTMASTFLTLVMVEGEQLSRLLMWWTLMQTVTLVRVWDLRRWQVTIRQTAYDGPALIQRFSRGALTHALGWAAFSFLFFHNAVQTDRSAMGMILSAMASGAVTVLAPSLRLAVQYCICLLVPISLLFLAEGGRANSILGFLGIVFCAILI